MLNSLYTSIPVFPYPLFPVLHSFLIELKKSYFNSLSSLSTSHASLPSALCSPFSPPQCSSFDPQVQIPHAPSSFVHRLIQHLALEHLIAQHPLGHHAPAIVHAPPHPVYLFTSLPVYPIPGCLVTFPPFLYSRLSPTFGDFSALIPPIRFFFVPRND